MIASSAHASAEARPADLRGSAVELELGRTEGGAAVVEVHVQECVLFQYRVGDHVIAEAATLHDLARELDDLLR